MTSLASLQSVSPSLQQFVRLSRPYNALLPIGAIVAGYSISSALHLDDLLWSVLIFAVLHGMVTIWNDIEDEAGDTFNGISRMTAVRKAGNYRLYIGWLIGLAILGLVAGFVVLPPRSELILAAYMILGWLYNSRPARLSKRPIGSMVIMFLAYGIVPFALGASLGHWYWQVGVLGLAWSFARLSLSLLKDYKDAVGDAKAAKKTFLLVYGNRLTSRLSIGLLAVGLAGDLWIVADHYLSLMLAVIVALAVWVFRERLGLLKHDDYRSLHRVFRDGLQYQLIFDVAVIAWLTIW